MKRKGHLNLFTDLVESLSGDNHKFRPTEIYNEGWLLRILLNEYSKNRNIESPLKFYPDAVWYSEAMLPTRFKARKRGDELAESRTNADGVIGHIKIGEKGKADLELNKDARQFTVIEAKLNSPLSKGTTKAPDFDQVARNVACMAEVLSREELCKKEIEHLSFIVIAPEDKIESEKKEKKSDGFSSLVNKESIRRKVKDRVELYKDNYEEYDEPEHKYESYSEWNKVCFEPMLQSIKLDLVSWEFVIAKLEKEKAEPIMEFYEKCKDYN